MNNENSKFAKVKNYLTVPAFAVLAIVFAEKTYAKETSENPDLNNFQEKNTPLTTNSNSEKFVKNEEIGIGFNEVAYNDIKKDTISPRKNINAKVSEVKTMSEKPDSKTIQDISTAVEGVAADLVPAEYPGGVNELRKKVSKNFNSAIFSDSQGLVKSTITFVVDKNGSIRDLKTEGENEKFNNEVLRVTKEANENITWKPATKDGEPVAYRYNLPMAMQFAAYNKAQ